MRTIGWGFIILGLLRLIGLYAIFAMGLILVFGHNLFDAGKKIMHVENSHYHKAFLPHESFVLAPEQGAKHWRPNTKRSL